MTDPTVRVRVTQGRTGTTGPIGQPVQNPMGDLEMTPEVALYVGTLEGQLAAYAVNEVKYRVLLELLTGESWYSTRVDVDTNLLADIATQALIRRGMDGTDARVLVNRRLSFGVEETEAEAESAPVQPIPELVNQSPDMSARFRSWKQRRGDHGGLPREKPTVIPEDVEPQENLPEEPSGIRPETVERLRDSSQRLRATTKPSEQPTDTGKEPPNEDEK